MPEVSKIKWTAEQKCSSGLPEKVLISMYLAQITFASFVCELHLCWLGFSHMFNKNLSVPDRFPIGGQLYGKPPTVTSILEIHWTTTSLAIFIVGHSKICLVLDIPVPLSRASCIWSRTYWCRVLVFLLPLLPLLLPCHYTGASATATASITISIFLLHSVTLKMMLLPPTSV